MKCGFIGHSDSFGIELSIYSEIKKLIASGVTEFYSGGMGNFDKMCEKIAKELGGKVTLIAYSSKQIKKQAMYDYVICSFGDKPYSKYDIPNRNKLLVDSCDILLCYVHKSGGAKSTYDYAIKRQKKIINIDK